MSEDRKDQQTIFFENEPKADIKNEANRIYNQLSGWYFKNEIRLIAYELYEQAYGDK